MTMTVRLAATKMSEVIDTVQKKPDRVVTDKKKFDRRAGISSFILWPSGILRADMRVMSIYDRLTRYHAESRSSFILFTEFIAFVGTMATMVGISFLRELLG